MSSMSFSLRLVGLVLFAGVSAVIGYQNIELMHQLEIAKSETGRCLTLNRTLQLAFSKTQTELLEFSATYAPEGRTELAATNRSHSVIDPVQNSSNALPGIRSAEPMPRPSTLQEVFQVKADVQSPPISTVSPLGTGPWGTGNP